MVETTRRGTTAFRVCDRRWPFLWADDRQPEGRWHGPGQGPCHYLSNTPDAAWAETLRRADIREADELDDLERSMWLVHFDVPTSAPSLAEETLTGDESTYPACQAEVDALRSQGVVALEAPSAALLPPGAPLVGVDAGGEHVVGAVAGVTFAVFGAPDELTGQHVADGCPDLGLRGRVRYL